MLDSYGPDVELRYSPSQVDELIRQLIWEIKHAAITRPRLQGEVLGILDTKATYQDPE